MLDLKAKAGYVLWKRTGVIRWRKEESLYHKNVIGCQTNEEPDVYGTMSVWHERNLSRGQCEIFFGLYARAPHGWSAS